MYRDFAGKRGAMDLTEVGDEIAVEPLRVENGFVELPTAPGLGLELDEAALLRRPYRRFPPRSFGPV